jgi:hypothetical protein
MRLSQRPNLDPHILALLQIALIDAAKAAGMKRFKGGDGFWMFTGPFFDSVWASVTSLASKNYFNTASFPLTSRKHLLLTGLS